MPLASIYCVAAFSKVVCPALAELVSTIENVAAKNSSEFKSLFILISLLI
jgi:hypothetical protein